MKLSEILRAQHLGWHFKKHWHIQGKRVPIDTKAALTLEKMNKEIVDINKFIYNNRAPSLNTNLETSQQSRSLSEECLVYDNKQVLLEGLTQAKVLTNTIEINSLPKRLEEFISKCSISNVVNKNVQEAIFSSFLFNAEQEKISRTKIPEKPAFVLPRNYGIPDNRKSLFTFSKLLLECEKMSRNIEKRRIVNDVNIIASFIRDENRIYIKCPLQVLITSNNPIKSFEENYSANLPDMYPLKPTVSLQREKKPTILNFYPLEAQTSNPHTIVTFCSPTNVKNLNETPVTTTQLQARTLMAAFATAIARAQVLYGDTKIIPKPVIVQSIQTDGRTFHFGVYQLNSLDLDNTDGIKNYWFHLPSIDLFDKCYYARGRPKINKYNSELINYLRALYENN